MKKEMKRVCFKPVLKKEPILLRLVSEYNKKAQKDRDKKGYGLHKIQTTILCIFLIVKYDQKNKLTDRFFD